MDVLNRLNALETIGIKLGLNNITTLLTSLGNPQNSFPSVLIAGTNGKGSVGAMLHEILSAHGLLTAHYTSPHLVDVRERVKVGRNVIPESDFHAELSTVFDHIDALLKDQHLENPPTYFETMTALAFHYFAKAKVDFAVVEVGMGGRFDATNILLPKLCVITSIGFDHEEFLGSSLSAIAFEKAGIVKKQTPVIAGNLSEEARQVLRKKSEEVGSSLVFADGGQIRNLKTENGFPIFEYEPWKQTLRINLRGRHQAENALVALSVCDGLKSTGLSLDQQKIAEALNQVEWPGRLELFSGTPPLLVDCAHNPMGTRALAQFLEDVGWTRAVALFTAMKDKKIGPMLRLVAPKIHKLYLTRVEPRTRCADSEQLQHAAKSLRIDFHFEEDFTTAFDLAREESQSTQTPLISFGSIYLIGEILRFKHRRDGIP